MGLLARLRRRSAAPPSDAPPALALEDVRRRLELLLAAVYERPITVAAAAPPRPPGTLRRLFRRIPPHLLPGEALPASDGERVLLPPRIAAERGDAVARYRLMAVQQAERLERGTVAALPADAPALVRDLYLLAESAAVEGAIARTAPGLVAAQAAEHAAALSRRPPLEALTPAERQVETLVRRVLSAGPGGALPELADERTPEQSLAWARETAARLADGGGRYRGVPPVDAWGTVLPGRGGPAAPKRPAGTDPFRYRPRPLGVGGKSQGPQGRGDAPQDGAGGESQLTSDPFDTSKPGKNGEGEGAAMAEGGDAASSGNPGDELRLGGGSSAAERQRSAQAQAPPVGIAYPEWDHLAGGYVRPGAWVRLAPTPSGDGEWARHVLQAHAATVRRLREQFERLRARRQRLYAQRDGEELDLAACVRALVDVRTGHTVSDRLYAAVRPARRELSILLLVDISGSTTEHVNRVRIIDVEMEALLLASEAFDALGDRFAILTFSGKGAQNVRMRVVKDFAGHNGDEVRGRISALRPEGYTRMGPAIRHASALLAREGAKHRLLLIISDGKPNDEDHYQGRYAVEDTRQAVAESRAQGIFPFCVTVDQKGGDYLSRIFGAAGHMILHDPGHLPLALLKVVRGLLRG